nr:immunoglobulin heavy chain junction region [Macaca mulatta]
CTRWNHGNFDIW